MQTAKMAAVLAISPMYAQKQGLSIFDLGNIALLQYERVRLFDRASQMRADRDMNQLRELMVELRAIEFEMQKWWKFIPDARKHTWWCRMPHCECNYDTNAKMVRASEPQVMEAACPLHGEGTGFSLIEGVDMAL